MTITLQQLSVQFSLKTALDSVSAEFTGSAVHAIVGENGAGKSTLASVLSGDRRQTSGTMLLDGTPVVFHTPRDAIAHGIVLVHQRPLLADSISVLENIMLGTEHSAPKRQIRARLDACRARWCPSLPLKSLVRDIGGDGRFFTSLLGALCRAPQVLILDEPTALLSWEQKRALYANLRTAAEEGMNIIIITHSMEEAALYTDTVTVLKKGRLDAQYSRSRDFTAGSKGYVDFTAAAVSTEQESEKAAAQDASLPVLSFDHITVRPAARPALFDICFKARRAQITLIKGLPEAGLETLENVITGMEISPCTGTVTIGSTTVQLARRALTPALLRHNPDCRAAVVPSDRTCRGSHPSLTVEQLLTTYYTGSAPVSYAQELIDRAGIMIKPDEPAANLSGGMLQRLILERELDTHPQVLILCEPLQGLDSAASARLCGRIYDLCRKQTAVIVLTSGDFPEPYCRSVYSLKNGALTIQGGSR